MFNGLEVFPTRFLYAQNWLLTSAALCKSKRKIQIKKTGQRPVAKSITIKNTAINNK